MPLAEDDADGALFAPEGEGVRVVGHGIDVVVHGPDRGATLGRQRTAAGGEIQG